MIHVWMADRTMKPPCLIFDIMAFFALPISYIFHIKSASLGLSGWIRMWICLYFHIHYGHAYIKIRVLYKPGCRWKRGCLNPPSRGRPESMKCCVCNCCWRSEYCKNTFIPTLKQDKEFSVEFWEVEPDVLLQSATRGWSSCFGSLLRSFIHLFVWHVDQICGLGRIISDSRSAHIKKHRLVSTATLLIQVCRQPNVCMIAEEEAQ